MVNSVIFSNRGGQYLERWGGSGGAAATVLLRSTHGQANEINDLGAIFRYHIRAILWREMEGWDSRFGFSGQGVGDGKGLPPA
jgi:hypothetical protein